MQQSEPSGGRAISRPNKSSVGFHRRLLRLPYCLPSSDRWRRGLPHACHHVACPAPMLPTRRAAETCRRRAANMGRLPSRVSTLGVRSHRPWSPERPSLLWRRLRRLGVGVTRYGDRCLLRDRLGCLHRRGRSVTRRRCRCRLSTAHPRLHRRRPGCRCPPRGSWPMVATGLPGCPLGAA